MKRFLLRLVLLAAPFAALLVWCEYRFAVATPSHIGAKGRLFKARMNEIEVLVLGSSHSGCAVAPRQLHPRAFSAANAGQTLYYDHAIVKHFLTEIPTLKCVIVPVSYMSLESEAGEAGQRHAHYYQREWGLPHAWTLQNSSAFFLLRENLDPWSLLFGPIHNALDDLDAWGGSREPPKMSPGDLAAQPDQVTPALAAVRVRAQHTELSAGHIPRNLELLHDLQVQLARRGITLVLISIPVSSDYAAHMRPETYARMQDSLKTFATTTRTPYINYMLDPRFPGADFSDPDHLNPTGAEKFTRILRDDLEARGAFARRMRD